MKSSAATKRMLVGLSLAGLGLAAPSAVQAEETRWDVSGEVRMRYESLGGQFRAGGEGGDQLLLFRSLAHARYDAGPVRFGVELQDSRTYLADDGTPLSSSITNPLDILQLYGEFDAPGLLGEGSDGFLRLGRQTVIIGSKRHIQRVSFANVIKSYTGAHFRADNERGDRLHLYYMVPLGIEPNTRPALDDNELSGDEEQWGRQVWGVQYERADILPQIASGLRGEIYMHALTEEDRDDAQTPDRDYYTPGFRILRKKAAGAWDMDLEGAWRFGSRRETNSPDDETHLDVSATMLVAIGGYTFDHPWKPRIALEYFWNSGDEDPADDKYDQFERLFGARRSDLNNTSIHGPLTPANINAPGFRVEAAPSKRMNMRLHYSAVYLASDTDTWVVARQRDPTGESGSFVGHTIDTRFIYWLAPDELELELGASLLLKGAFAKDAPNPGDPEDTAFGYAALRFVF